MPRLASRHFVSWSWPISVSPILYLKFACIFLQKFGIGERSRTFPWILSCCMLVQCMDMRKSRTCKCYCHIENRLNVLLQHSARLQAANNSLCHIQVLTGLSLSTPSDPNCTCLFSTATDQLIPRDILTRWRSTLPWVWHQQQAYSGLQLRCISLRPLQEESGSLESWAVDKDGCCKSYHLSSREHESHHPLGVG